MVFGWKKELSPSIMGTKNPNWSFIDSRQRIFGYRVILNNISDKIPDNFFYPYIMSE
jgi:hypothetical protein